MESNSINSVNPVQIQDSIQNSVPAKAGSSSKIYAMNAVRLAAPALASLAAKTLVDFCKYTACALNSYENQNFEQVPCRYNVYGPLHDPYYQFYNPPPFRTSIFLTGLAAGALIQKSGILGNDKIRFETALTVGGSAWVAGASAPVAVGLGLGSELLVRMPGVQNAAAASKKIFIEKVLPAATTAANRAVEGASRIAQKASQIVDRPIKAIAPFAEKGAAMFDSAVSKADKFFNAAAEKVNSGISAASDKAVSCAKRCRLIRS